MLKLEKMLKVCVVVVVVVVVAVFSDAKSLF